MTPTNLPAGSTVDVLLDDGSTRRTRTRSVPWQLAHGAWVVLIEGLAGGYLLSRCTPVEGPGPAPLSTIRLGWAREERARVEAAGREGVRVRQLRDGSWALVWPDGHVSGRYGTLLPGEAVWS